MMKSALSLITCCALVAPFPLSAQDDPVSLPEAVMVDDVVEEPIDPAMQAALTALDIAPVFDGHNDVPYQLRTRYQNQIDSFDFTDTSGTGANHPDGRVMHTDLNRLREAYVLHPYAHTQGHRATRHNESTSSNRGLCGGRWVRQWPTGP